MEVQARERLNKGILRIVTLFNEVVNEEDSYLKNLEEWFHHRRNTLAELEKFQKELERIHLYGNTGRVAGEGAAILGGLATFIGFGLSFSKNLKPIGEELMKYGKVVGTVGGVTALTASIVEAGFNAKTLSDVKAALKKDLELTEKLLPSFQRAVELESAMKEVFGFSVLSDGISDILKFIREIYTLKHKSSRSWSNFQNYLQYQAKSNFSNNLLLEDIFCNASHKMQLLLQELFRTPEMRKATFSLYDCFKNNPVSFDLSRISFRIVRKAAMQPDLIGHSAMSSAGLALQGLFRTVSFALSVVAFISTLEDIKEGGSRYSAKVEEVKISLKKELTIIESHNMNRNIKFTTLRIKK